jgi:hypothetical protein
VLLRFVIQRFETHVLSSVTAREREKRERISECFLALGTLVGSPFADQLTILLRACEG